MFRLRVIASVLFLIGVTAASYSGICKEFRIANTAYTAMAKPLGDYSLWPTFSVAARGSQDLDYQK